VATRKDISVAPFPDGAFVEVTTALTRRSHSTYPVDLAPMEHSAFG
jgi:hypothetical protein